MKHPGRVSFFQKEAGDLPSGILKKQYSHRRGQKQLKGTRVRVKLCPPGSLL